MSNPLKKTMVFLGLAEEDLDGQETGVVREAESAAPAARPAQPRAAQVTPLRKVTPTRQAPAQAMSEILTVHPSAYSDAAAVAESFRDGVPVILNLSRMNDAEAKRIIDFASGLSMGLHGKIERVTSKVFLLSPEHITTSGDQQSRNEDGSFFVGGTA
ncbi:cell division protein SepF [Leucobacter weissii]|uniref:Cell division protein SepF n=1 Tax=Leucobacter weissii TaxID=1983706 RepID=A0A939MJA9_9MICO|nr:cell division protein SepF [Leucobacter weissii]MBO1901998.1 cell division protein SepF [Leucobacter weissii]